MLFIELDVFLFLHTSQYVQHFLDKKVLHLK